MSGANACYGDAEWVAEQQDRLEVERELAARMAENIKKLQASARRAGTPWPEGIGPATAAALGISLDELAALDAGQLAPPVALPAGRPFGAVVEIAGAVLHGLPGISAKVEAELKRASEFIKLTNMPELLKALRLVDPEAADKLRDCADPECGTVLYCPAGDFAQYCNDRCWLRICPNCAKTIAGRLRDKLGRVLDEIQKARAPGFSLKHMTPTIKRTRPAVEGLPPDEALFARAKESQKDIEEFHDMDKALVHSCCLGNDKRAGASAYLEFGPQGGNIHAHNVLYCAFVPQAQLSDEWRRLSLQHRRMWRPWVSATLAMLQARKAHYAAELRALGRSRSVRARRLRLVVASMTRRRLQAQLFKMAKRQGIGDYIVDIRQISAERALAEVVKYVTKLHKRNGKGEYETPVEDLVALHLALKGKRRAWSWGSFYGVDLPEPEEKAEPQCCPNCGGVLLGATVPELRALLHSKDESNCPARSHPAAFNLLLAMAAGP